MWELRDGPHRLSHREFVAWIEFYKLQPFDDMHRIHRPAALIARSMGGTEIEHLLQWLQPPPVSVDTPEGLSAADLATLNAFGIKVN